MLGTAVVLSAALASSAFASGTDPPDLALTSLGVSGIEDPLAVREPNDGSGRLFIVSRTGGIFIYRNGALLQTPFLTVPVGNLSEQGLLGLAFHPQFSSNGRFFVQHSRAPGGPDLGPSADQLTVEYRVSATNPDLADPESRVEILRLADLAPNHNGNDLHFGPDGYLYVSQGDGGGPQGDPNGFAQCLWRKPADDDPVSCAQGSGVNYALLGKILRIDIDGTTDPAPPEMCGMETGARANYRIPPDNPHVGTAGTCDEIWHHGLRNPFRFSFDRATGEMLVGDVGLVTWEELSVLPAGVGGLDLGWRECEGRHLRGSTTDFCPTGALPAFAYRHALGRCSITAGFRYRGPVAPLRGTIVFADFCSREIFMGRPDADSESDYSAERWERAPGDPVLATGMPIGFGEGVDGTLYLATRSGVFRFDSPATMDLLLENGFE